jgi:hypothetical protein
MDAERDHGEAESKFTETSMVDQERDDAGSMEIATDGAFVAPDYQTMDQDQLISGSSRFVDTCVYIYLKNPKALYLLIFKPEIICR